MDGKQACVLMVRHSINSTRIEQALCMWWGNWSCAFHRHVKFVFYSQTESLKTNVLSERRRVQKAVSWLHSWKLLTSMGFNNHKQSGSFCFHRCIDFEMPTVCMESKCLEALLSLVMYFKYKLQQTFCNGLLMTSAFSEGSH